MYESGMTQREIADLEGVSRQRINQIIRKAADSSRKVTKGFVEKGFLPDPKTLKCKYCESMATEYDHRDYSKPKIVDAVCHACNNRLGEGKNGKWNEYVKPKPRTDRERRRMAIRDLIPYSTDLEAAAKKLKIGKGYLGSILNCTVRPGASLVVKICKIFPQIEPYMLRPDIFDKTK